MPSPEQIEANVHILRVLYGADVVDPHVEVNLSPEQVTFLARMGLLGHPDAHARMSLIDPGMLAPDVEVALLEATVPGGILDPCRLGGDLVWVVAIKAVLEVDVAGASRFARKLHTHLLRLGWNSDPGAVHPVTFSVSAYVVAFVEHSRGRGHEVRRWLWEADAHVANEDPHGLAILAFLRFCRLWVGVDGKG